ncbi:MAG: HupE/UreJ family protein [Litoreibacter sp.]|nr:HupE/UreJ family protein [Litoreibacter sp.]
MVATFTFVSPAAAHEIRPAIADATLSPERIELQITLSAEALVAGIDLEGLADTNDAPGAEQYDALRALPDEAFADEVRQAWNALREGVIVDADGTRLLLDLDEVTVQPQSNIELPRDTVITLSGALPDNGADVRLGWIAAYGPIIMRQMGAGDDAYAGFLDGGALSDPLPRVGTASESSFSVFVRYIAVGFDHIIPKGLDHILFVLGLFFLSLKARPLITQVTLFTLAHTTTLALASLGYVTVSASIVEPLIAASIVYVAVENIFTDKITPWRPIVIFLFGLLHGLGFASVLEGYGLTSGQFVAGLIGFNVGVELGQLAVIGLAYLIVGHWFGSKPWYRDRIAIPASVAIAIMGGYWAIERVFL